MANSAGYERQSPAADQCLATMLSSAAMNRRPKIVVVAATGTINAIGKDRLDLAAYQETGIRLAPDDLLARIPEVHDIARVDIVPGAGFEGPSTSLNQLVSFIRSLHSIASDPSVAGLVVTKGTNSLEEFAYATHLALRTEKPIVFVGAMRPASAMSGDGDLNLLRAVQIASDQDAAGQGVLVFLNDTIYSARDATKGSTYRVNSFTGRDLGPLGYADADGRIMFYHRQLRRHTTASFVDLQKVAAMPRVDIIVSYLGADGALVEAAAAAGAQGIVSSGMGAGFPTAIEMEALRNVHANGVAVCIAARVGSGRVVARPRIVKNGFFAADNLVPWKARILLAFALEAGLSLANIQDVFDTH